MIASQNYSDLDEYIRNLEMGQHISCIYKSDSQLYSLLVPFVTSALQKNCQFLYITYHETPEEIVAKFKNFGLDLSPYLNQKNLLFVPYSEIYFDGDVFSAPKAISQFLKLEDQSLADGFYGVYLVGGASWLAEHPSAASDLIKYEALINSALLEQQIVAVCTYLESAFSEGVLIEMLRTHPDLFIYDKFVASEYFAASDNFIPLAQTDPLAHQYQNMIQASYSPVTKDTATV